MTLFPMFLKLDGRTCLVVGAGSVAESKIRSLLAAGANVRVVAPHARKCVADWARAGVIVWEPRRFETRDLRGAFLVIAATGSTELNKIIFRRAQKRRILCNAVDDPANCDFYFPAVVRRGDLQIAVSTGGRSPALAQRLRRELEVQFPSDYAGWVRELGKSRDRVLDSDVAPDMRRKLLHELAGKKQFDSWRLRTRNTAEEIRRER